MTREEFDAAVAKHGRRVFTLAVYLLGDREEAEDVTQEVLIRLWRRGHEVASEKIGSWLVRVTRNACVDAFRHNDSGIRAMTDSVARWPSDLSTGMPGPEGLANASQLSGRILGALRELSEPHRSVVILREIEGLSYLEIAEALEMPLSSVRVTLHRGRRHLREELRGVRDHVEAC